MSENHKKFLLFVLYAALAIGFIYFILPRCITLFLPFIIAYILAKIIEPLVNFLNKRFKLNRKIGAIIGILIAIGLIVTLIVTIASRIYREARELIINFPLIKENFIEYANHFLTFGLGSHLPESVRTWAFNVLENINDFVLSFVTPSFAGTSWDITRRILSSVPGTLIFFIVTILSTYMISSDSRTIYNGLMKYMPESFSGNLSKTKNTVFFALGAYLKAQLILMCITFVEMSIWFLCLNVKYGLAMAFLTALVDALPFFGTGTVLVPWAVYSFITGNYVLGISLLIAYGVAFVIRQLLEPKLVSVQIGLHPLLTIMSVYIGLNLLGFIGVVIGPTITIIVVEYLKTHVKANELYDKDEKA